MAMSAQRRAELRRQFGIRDPIAELLNVGGWTSRRSATKQEAGGLSGKRPAVAPQISARILGFGQPSTKPVVIEGPRGVRCGVSVLFHSGSIRIEEKIACEWLDGPSGVRLRSNDASLTTDGIGVKLSLTPHSAGGFQLANHCRHHQTFAELMYTATDCDVISGRQEVHKASVWGLAFSSEQPAVGGLIANPDRGTLHGLAAPYNRVSRPSQSGRRFRLMPRCFTASLASGKPVCLLLDHDYSRQFGNTQQGGFFRVADRADGIHLSVDLDTDQGREVAADLRRHLREHRELSIGFTATRTLHGAAPDGGQAGDRDGVLWVTEAELHEVSLVKLGALTGTYLK